VVVVVVEEEEEEEEEEETGPPRHVGRGGATTCSATPLTRLSFAIQCCSHVPARTYSTRFSVHSSE